MIAMIRGKAISETFTQVIVDVNGVGYRVFIPMSTYDKLPHDPNKEVTLLTSMQVKEDSITLFGFATEQEKEVFELLITVNGIGAKSAVSILSCMNISSLCSAIINEDVKTLKKISGVGPKSAERIIIELRDKIGKISPEAELGLPAGSMGGANNNILPKEAEDALLALEQLGFQSVKLKKSVTDILAQLPEEQRSTENIIRKVLQSINKQG